MQEFDSDSRFDKDFPQLWEDMIENKGKLDYPDSFDFVPTLRCNLNCQGCFQKKNRFYKKQEMDIYQMCKMFDGLDIEDRIVKLIGGEIFVRYSDYNFDIINLLHELTARNAHIIIGTNALNIPDVERFKDWNIAEITTSIDGLARTHDKLRGMIGAFKNTRDFIYDMGKYGLGYKVNVTSMLYKECLSDVKEVIKLKDKLGMNALRFQIPKWSTSEEIYESMRVLGTDSVLDVSKQPYDYTSYDLWETIRYIYDMDKIFIQPSYYWRNPDATHGKQIRSKYKCMCTYLFRGKINPNGDVNPCFYILNSMGNLKNQSFEEIWNSNRYRKFRMKMAKNNMLPICENCCSLRILEK